MLKKDRFRAIEGKRRNPLIAYSVTVISLALISFNGVLVLGGYTPAYGTCMYVRDQVHEAPIYIKHSCGYPPPPGFTMSLYQSFTPSSPTLAGVDIPLGAGSGFPGSYVTNMKIRSGTYEGPVLIEASTTVTCDTLILPTLVVAEFRFPTPICVIPGGTYVIEWESPTDPVFLTWPAAYDSYDGGSAFGCSGDPYDPEEDFIFRTYKLAPAQVIFNADFNSDTPGQMPDLNPPGDPSGDYIKLWDSTVPYPDEEKCNNSIRVEDAPNGGFDTKSLLIHKAISITGGCSPIFEGYPDPSYGPYDSGVFIVRWRSSSAQSDGDWGFVSLEIQSAFTVFYWGDGKIRYGDPNVGGAVDTGVSYEDNVPQSFEAVVNLSTRTYDLYIDGWKVLANRDFYRNFSFLHRFVFEIGGMESEKYSIDDIQIFRLHPDADGDCLCDSEDNCPSKCNPGQVDVDGDTVGDACDNCPQDFNPGQADSDIPSPDGVGDACDNCKYDPNRDQADFNENGIGNLCETCAVGKPEEQPEVQPTFEEPPTDPQGFPVGGPIDVVGTAIFYPVDWDGGNPDPTDFVDVSPFNLIASLYGSGELIADRVLCGPPCTLYAIEFGGDLITVTDPNGIPRSATIPLTEWFTKLGPGCYDVAIRYVSHSIDPHLDRWGNCTLPPDPDTGESTCYDRVWVGETESQYLSFCIGQDSCADDGIPEGEGAGNTGCQFADKIAVMMHEVYIGKTGKAPSTKYPLPLAQVRVYDRTDSGFLEAAGSQNPEASKYPEIWEWDQGRVGRCITTGEGYCYAGENDCGSYLVIVKYFDPGTGKYVYVGRPMDCGDYVDNVGEKDVQIIKIFKDGAFYAYRGGSKTCYTGSLLEVISPESGIWDGTRSLYPFIFTSDSDWTVDVCAEVPSGYTIVGVYDDNGDLIPSVECVQTFVSGETKVVAFEVQEVGSPEPWLGAALELKDPKGEKIKEKVKVYDVRKKTLKAKIAELRAKKKKK